MSIALIRGCGCSAPKWRLDCNKCSFLIYLPENLHAARVSKDKLCQVSPIPSLSLKAPQEICQKSKTLVVQSAGLPRILMDKAEREVSVACPLD